MQPEYKKIKEEKHEQHKQKIRRNIITINSVESSEATCSLNGKICKNILIGLQWRRDNEYNLAVFARHLNVTKAISICEN